MTKKSSTNYKPSDTPALNFVKSVIYVWEIFASYPVNQEVRVMAIFAILCMSF